MFATLLTHFYVSKMLFLFKQFRFQNKLFSYFCHRYNATWKNERAVEIPIALSFLAAYRGKDILEFGNVLSHYINTDHVVVDKYEKAPGVFNLDVVSLNLQQKFDLIIGVSTLEHVGWDEALREPLKVLKAIRVLQQHLKPTGKLILTFPVGYNPYIRLYLKAGLIPKKNAFFMRRTSYFNTWKQVAFGAVVDAQYGYPYENANAICVLELSAK